MKRMIAVLMILATVVCVGCSKDQKSKPAEATDPTATTLPVQLPRGLEGEWMSASAGERGYTESIVFGEDGSLSVSSLKDGVVQQTIYGTFYVDGNKIVFHITEGTTPYESEFQYTLDGRELYLIDDDGMAHYLRTS